MSGADGASADAVLAEAIDHANAGRGDRALHLCEDALARFPPHPGLLQLFAVLLRQGGHPAEASRAIEASLTLRPDHVPLLLAA